MDPWATTDFLMALPGSDADRLRVRLLIDVEMVRRFTIQYEARIDGPARQGDRYPRAQCCACSRRLHRIDDIDAYWSPRERALSEQLLRYAFVGSPETVERGLRGFLEAHQPDELMVTGHIYDHAARPRSFTLLAGVRGRLAASLDAGFTPEPEQISTWS